MKIGPLRNRIEILSYTESQDNFGEVTKTWEAEGAGTTVWAEVRAVSGKEIFDSSQVQAHVTHKITIRHFNGLTPQDKIVYDSRTFEIQSVLPDNRKTFMQLMCVERVQ